MKQVLITLMLMIIGVSCNSDSLYVSLESKEYEHPKELSLFVFISPECPLCENYTKDFNDLRSQYSTDSLKIYGVFSGKKLYSDERILKFKKQYDLQIDFVMDGDYRIAKYFKAEVTPECFLVKPGGEIAYSGKLDNWLEKLGRRRKKVSRFYVKDAINSVFNKEPITVAKTEAIGCLMQY